MASDIENKADAGDIPTAVSQLTNDMNYLVQNDVSNLALADDVYSKNDIDTSIAAHYYSKAEADNTFITEQQTQEILSDYVTKSSAAAYLTVTDISAKADKSELGAYVTTEQLNNILYADDNGIIDKFNEITDFLANIAEDDDITLTGLLNQLEEKIPTDYVSTNDIQAYITTADASNIYVTKESLNTSINELKTAINNKIDSNDVYTKHASDEKYATKTDISIFAESGDVYTKDEINSSFVTKDDARIYLISNDISAKADRSELSNYITSETFNNMFSATDADAVINTYKEIENFLQGVSDASTLTGILMSMQTPINASIFTIKRILNSIDSSWGEYYSKGEIDAKHYLVANDISTKAEKNEIPHNISDLINDAGFTTNTGTLTGITMNNESIVADENGIIDLGNVITQHQSLDEYAKIADVDACIGMLNSSVNNADSSIVYIKERIDNIDTSWSYYYDKNDINNHIDIINSSILRTDSSISILNNAVNNADSSIESIKERIDNIDSSWDYYYDKNDIDNRIDIINSSILRTDSGIGMLNSSANNADSSIVDIKERLDNIDTSWNHYYDKETINASVNGINNSINNISGRLDNIDSSWDYYYDKETINASIIEYAQPKGNYLTEHQPLDEYAKIANVSENIEKIDASIKNTDSSIESIRERIDNIDSSWDHYYDKNDTDDIVDNINVSINDINSSIIRIDENLDILNASVNNADSSIISIKERLNNIDSSWGNYLTVDTFNNIVNADTDNTINKFNEIVDFLEGIDQEDGTLYNTLYSINASIDDVSARLNNINSSWDYYYNKIAIDSIIESVNTSVNSINSSITRIDGNIDTLRESANNTDSSIISIKERLNNIDTSWGNYYDKNDIDNHIDIINSSIIRIDDAITAINSSINNADSSIETIKERLDNIDTSWEHYYDKNDINDIINSSILRINSNIGMLSSSVNNTDSSIVAIKERINNIDSSWDHYYDKNDINNHIDIINSSIIRLDGNIDTLRESANNADSSIVAIKERIDNIDSSWDYYYDKNDINNHIDITNSSIIRIDDTITVINGSINNAGSSIESIKERLNNIDTSWDYYYDKESINASANNIDSSIVAIKERLDNIDSSWDYYYDKNDINNHIDIINSSILRINSSIGILSNAANNADSSIESIKERLYNIDTSWDYYYDKESINASVNDIDSSIESIKERLDNIDSSWGYYYDKNDINNHIDDIINSSISRINSSIGILNSSVNNADSSIESIKERIDNIDTSWGHYYDKESINASVNDINSSIVAINGRLDNIDTSWDHYYDKETINASIVAYAQPKGEYLTEHQSLDEYMKISDVSGYIEKLDISIKNADTSIISVKARLDNIDSSWDYYYDKEYINTNNDNINASINNVNSSIIRIGTYIDILNSSANNTGNSIGTINERLDNIDSSWTRYLTVDTFNNIVNADADETINKFNEIVDFLAGIDPQDDTLYNTLY